MASAGERLRMICFSRVRLLVALTLLSGVLAGCAGGGRSLPLADATASTSGSAPLAAPPRLPAAAVVPRRPSFIDAAPPAPVRERASSGSRAPLAVHPSFFQGENALSNGVYYLAFANSNIFGYYSYLPDPNYIYHFDLGYEYLIDANDGKSGVYLYDFASTHWWYTSPTFSFPYLYDFTLNAFIYYYPDTQKPQHYTTNPRWFYNFGTGQIITIPNRDVLRSDAQAILTAGKVLTGGGYSTGSSPLGAMAIVRLVRARRIPHAAPSCNSLGANGSNTVTDTTDAQGTNTQTYTDYYDAHCQQIERVAVLIYPKGSSISGGTVTGSTTAYDHAGAVTGYGTFQSAFDANNMTVQTADSKTVGGPIVGRSGATCKNTSATAETCGLASFAAVAGTTTGLTETVSESFATSQNGFNSTVTAQIGATTYTGSGLALVSPASGSTAWGLSGGTQLDSITASNNSSYQGSFVSSASYSANDSTAGITASGSLANPGQVLTITLSQGGSTVATIVVDADGNGTITYASDNNIENVAGFTIFG